MRNNTPTITPTITLRSSRLRFPPRAETRARLPAVAAKLREMQDPFSAYTEGLQRMKDQMDELRNRLREAQQANVERTQRAERMKTYGGRTVDGRAAWEAKMGLRQKQPLVCLTSQRIVTADVWTQQVDE